MKKMTEAKAWRVLRDMYEEGRRQEWGYSGPYICNVLALREPITARIPVDLTDAMYDRIRQHICVEETLSNMSNPLLENWENNFPCNDGLQVRAMFCELMALECLEEEKLNA